MIITFLSRYSAQHTISTRLYTQGCKPPAPLGSFHAIHPSFRSKNSNREMRWIIPSNWENHKIILNVSVCICESTPLTPLLSELAPPILQWNKTVCLWVSWSRNTILFDPAVCIWAQPVQAQTRAWAALLGLGAIFPKSKTPVERKGRCWICRSPLNADEFIEIPVKSYCCAVGNFQVLIKRPVLPSNTPAPKIAVNTWSSCQISV